MSFLQILRSRRRFSLLLVVVTAACRLGSAQTAASSSELGQYVGEYRWNSNPDVVMSVYREAGKLYEEREGRLRRQLSADTTPDHFSVAALASHVVFLRGADGSVTGLRIMLDADAKVLENGSVVRFPC